MDSHHPLRRETYAGEEADDRRLATGLRRLIAAHGELDITPPAHPYGPRSASEMRQERG